jgi:hypothetical protein
MGGKTAMLARRRKNGQTEKENRAKDDALTFWG